MRIVHIAAAALMLTALAGCAAGDLVVVLPHEDGSVGGVSVTKGARQVLLDKPLAATKTGGGLDAFTIETAEVDKRFSDALAAQPVAPRSYSLYFEEGSTRLHAGSKAVLQEILADVARRPSAEITVIGHTDRIGKVPDNDALSRRRAAAVVDFLVTNGVKRDIMSVAGRGEREPIVPTPDETEEPRNRRAEISVR
ncbi:MAG: OmpA family protein [Rhodospirillaceae bacterium]|nr:OmpA family protein [Rhodospirillaceae bacterium]